jgi:hypothetical protein
VSYTVRVDKRQMGPGCTSTAETENVNTNIQ